MNSEVPGFRMIRQLGAGAFGSVWLAEQPSFDREVAIKIAHRPLVDDSARLRFERECRALGRLSGNANIVAVHVAGTLDDGRPYLVLEYVTGGTLWDRVVNGPLATGQLLGFGQQIAEALDSAHDLGILHRDIKPENVLLRHDDSAVLGDFGIAVLRDGALTASAAITASVPFAAPEVLMGRKATVASDLYSLGATILASGTRNIPFVEHTDEGLPPVLNRVLTVAPPTLTSVGYAEPLSRVVSQLMEKEPEHRPQSAADAAALFAEAARAIERSAGADERSDPSPDLGRTSAVPAHQPPPVPGLASTAAPGWVAPPTPPPNPPAPISASNPVVSPVVNPAPQTVMAQPHPSPPPGVGGAFPASEPPNGGNRRTILILVSMGLLAVVMGGAGLFLLRDGSGGDTTATPNQLVETGGGETVDGDSAEGASAEGASAESGSDEPTSPTTTPDGSGDDSVSTIADLTPTGPELGPIGLPLESQDANMPVGLQEVELANQARNGFCDRDVATDGLVEEQNSYFNDFNANDQLSQAVARFETEQQARDYVDAIVDSTTCGTWDDVTTDNSAAYSAAIGSLSPQQRFADDTLAWAVDVEFENGFEVGQRFYVVRRFDRVLTVGVLSDEPDRLEQVPELMGLMLNRLGYDG